MEYNWDSMFENSDISFTIYNEPVSLQNKEDKGEGIMIKELKKEIEYLKEKRQTLRRYIKEYEEKEDMQKLANICKGQVIELRNQIQYLEKLVAQIEG